MLSRSLLIAALLGLVSAQLTDQHPRLEQDNDGGDDSDNDDNDNNTTTANTDLGYWAQLQQNRLDRRERLRDRRNEGSEHDEGNDLDNDATDPSQTGYFATSLYQSKGRYEKLDELWNKIVPDPDVIEGPAPQMWKEFAESLRADREFSFEDNTDEMREGRIKLIHTQGLHAKVQWVPTERGMQYSGIYNTGSDTVIIRLSQTSNLHEDSVGLHPSIALKFLIDGQKSENIMAMPNFTGTRSWDFFSEEIYSRLPRLDTTGTVKKDTCMVPTHQRLNTDASPWPYACGISTLADKYNDATEIKKRKVDVPFELQFDSPYRGQFTMWKEMDGDTQVMWYEQLRNTIHEGDVIYEVFALPKPEEMDGDYVKIADLVLLSDLYTSLWGDQKLFFQHEQVQPDFKYQPRSWVREGPDRIKFDDDDENDAWGDRPIPYNIWPEDDDAAAKTFWMAQEATYGCPFAWLLGDY